ncbi:unnamed protein product [Bursaphelenchus xylophilus]|uniref:(pine wood nematode) hypothetical protein n=1 Tax=Bursaphelenchus xylophilus TaxID=6326 RepID=A0A1I7RJR0_BURXY|nr:unnamed protein product [Bursaphelenchus xylophilus]CAG9128995.1 unnamed protein product [Bursaphelenchus xylophilus]
MKETCHFYSFWVSTGEPMTAMMNPIPGTSIRPHISHCSVCEIPTQIIAVHSQDSYVPECPGGCRRTTVATVSLCTLVRETVPQADAADLEGRWFEGPCQPG